MEHVVFFPAAEGTAFRRLPSLEEAVRLVEHLRNVEGVGDVSLHALTEVPLSFRAYYRVEVPTSVVAPQPPSLPVQPVAAAAELAPPPRVAPPEPETVPAAALALVDADPEPVVEPEPVPPSPAGRGKDSAAGLGFFA